MLAPDRNLRDLLSAVWARLCSEGRGRACGRLHRARGSGRGLRCFRLVWSTTGNAESALRVKDSPALNTKHALPPSPILSALLGSSTRSPGGHLDRKHHTPERATLGGGINRMSNESRNALSEAPERTIKAKATPQSSEERHRVSHSEPLASAAVSGPRGGALLIPSFRSLIAAFDLDPAAALGQVGLGALPGGLADFDLVDYLARAGSPRQASGGPFVLDNVCVPFDGGHASPDVYRKVVRIDLGLREPRPDGGLYLVIAGGRLCRGRPGMRHGSHRSGGLKGRPDRSTQ